jgi:WD40 repeat protein
VPADEGTAVAFARFGAFATGPLASGGARGVVRLWDPASGRPVGDLATGDTRVTDVAYDPMNRNVLATGGSNRLVRLWDTVGRRALTSFRAEQSDHAVFAFHPRRRGVLAYARPNGDVQVVDWDAETTADRDLRVIPTRLPAIETMAFDPVTEFLAVGSPGTVRVYDTDDGALVSSATGVPGRVTDLAFDPLTRNTLAVVCGDGALGIWDSSNGAWVRWMKDSRGVTSVAFHPLIRNSLTSGDGRGHVRIWDSSTGYGVREISGLPSAATSLAYDADGRNLAVGGPGGVTVQPIRDWGSG